MTEVAEATGKNVLIGRYGHRDDWFAHVDGIETQGPNPLTALEAVIDALEARAETRTREAVKAANEEARIKALRAGPAR